MKSPAHNAGNVNMRGKKEKLLRCRCCTCLDLRQKVIDEEHRKEMRGER